MEALLAELANLLPEAVLGIIVIVFVVYWQREQAKRDEQHAQQYRELAGTLSQVVQSNTRALERFCMVTDVLSELRRHLDLADG